MLVPESRSVFIPHVATISVSTETTNGNIFGQFQSGRFVLRGFASTVSREDGMIPLTSRNSDDGFESSEIRIRQGSW